jgi:predicted alpha/beta-fold hydrolase
VSPTVFRPPWWLPGGHSQTLWRKFGRGAAPALAPRERQRLELGDGDFIDIDWVRVAGDASARPVVLLMHGLCGCSASPYILSLQQLLAERGFDSAALNFRSCSGEPNRLARAYHSGASDDLESVRLALQQQMPVRRFAFIGFSLGANVLLKWLGEQPREATAAVAVSTPFSLALCSQAMSSGLGRLYGRYFLQQLTADLRLKQSVFAERGYAVELEKLRALGSLERVGTLWEFDDLVTAPLHGFKDAADYYAQSSSQRFLSGILAPTLIIHSRNDPIIPPSSIPDAADLPPSVLLEVHAAGGHVGFAAAGQSRWLEHRIVAFLEQQARAGAPAELD